jgi:hypothetical protein
MPKSKTLRKKCGCSKTKSKKIGNLGELFPTRTERMLANQVNQDGHRYSNLMKAYFTSPFQKY